MNNLLYTVENQIATFAINREPKLNALSAEVLQLFLRGLGEAEADPEVRVVVVTGSGERAFCTGGDLVSGELGENSPARLYARLLRRLSGFPKPSIARVNGYCLAGGMGLMLACDLASARGAARFGTPEGTVALWPMMIGALSYRNMPRRAAWEMVLRGEQFDAQRALHHGLITRAVPAEQLDVEVDAVAQQLAAKSPIGLRIGKQAFSAMADMPFEQAVDYLAGKLDELLATEDAREGMRAFQEKRRPNFTGH